MDEGKVELLANGLTFDLAGLGPSGSAETPLMRHFFGFAAALAENDLEAVTLVPGPHLLAGATMFPVVRSLAVLAAELSTLDNVKGIVWHTANAASEPEYFRRGVMGWIEGGVFPGLGLTALADKPDGAMQSEGLSLFTGQELLFPPDLAASETENARVAMRLINWVVEHGRIEQAVTFTGPSGEAIHLEPVENSELLRAWRRTH